MNLNDVHAITIPEGAVEKITQGNSVLWQRPYIYGVAWNKTNTSTLTRTNDASGFGSVVIGRGTITGSSPFDNAYPWSRMKKVVDGNNTLVEIPKFWYKWTNSGGVLSLQIADRAIQGFYVSPMHMDRGDGKGERNVAYIGRYKSATSNYRSVSGVLPQRSITRATARTKIASLGSGYYQQDFAAFWTLRMLYLVEFANWDGQSVLPRTSVPASANDIVTGRTDSMVYHTGTSSDGMAAQYRWVEDPWHTCYEWVDGIYFTKESVYIVNNPNNFSDTNNGVNIGTRATAQGYIKDWRIPNISGYEWALYPSSLTGNATKSYTCNYYYPESGNVLYTGAPRAIIDGRGSFMLYGDFLNTSTSSIICSRLMKLP